MTLAITSLEEQLRTDKKSLSEKIEAALEAKSLLDTEYTQLSEKFQVANLNIKKCEMKLQDTEGLNKKLENDVQSEFKLRKVR